MFFNFALHLYMTLSSADNPFKQFGPRSGPISCPGLIEVQNVWHFRGYDKLKLNLFFRLSVKFSCDIVICRYPFQTIWTQIRPDILSCVFPLCIEALPEIVICL